MSERQPLKATFFALRRREGAGFLLPATAMVLVVAVLLIVAFVGVNWPFFSAMGEIALQQGSSAPPSETLLLGAFAVYGWALIFLFLFYLLFAAYEAACLRWLILKERPGGLSGLSLSAPTWRVYSGYWIWLGIYIVVSMVAGALTAPFTYGVMEAAMAIGDPQQAMIQMLPYQAAQTALIYTAMIYIGIRLAPAAAVSIARRKFSFFHAWNVTKGRFWGLFGSFLVIWALVALLWIGFTVATMNMAFSVSLNGSVEELQAMTERFFSPEMISAFASFYVFTFLLSFVSVIFTYGVNARAVLVAIEEGKVEGVTPSMAALID